MVRGDGINQVPADAAQQQTEDFFAFIQTGRVGREPLSPNEVRLWYGAPFGLHDVLLDFRDSTVEFLQLLKNPNNDLEGTVEKLHRYNPWNYEYLARFPRHYTLQSHNVTAQSSIYYEDPPASRGNLTIDQADIIIKERNGRNTLATLGYRKEHGIPIITFAFGRPLSTGPSIKGSILPLADPEGPMNAFFNTFLRGTYFAEPSNTTDQYEKSLEGRYMDSVPYDISNELQIVLTSDPTIGIEHAVRYQLVSPSAGKMSGTVSEIKIAKFSLNYTDGDHKIRQSVDSETDREKAQKFGLETEATLDGSMLPAFVDELLLGLYNVKRIRTNTEITAENLLVQ